MRNFTKILTVAGVVLITSQGWAQGQNSGVLNCGHRQYTEKFLMEHPEYVGKFEEHNQELIKRAAVLESNRDLKNEKVYRIPVVFHVIHNYGPENISTEQAYSAIDVLNEEFGKTNAAAAQVVDAFKDFAADCNIEFRLATIDPNGNCTNGIIRYYDPRTEAADDQVKSGRQWPRNKYLNIYVVRRIGDAGVAGYAYYPGTASPGVDGVIINHDYVGRVGTGSQGRSSALTHEVGHYLSLSHTWGNNNDPGQGCGGTDYVNDTPECAGSSVCNLNANTCGAGLPGDKIDNIQNYMEYAYCYAMFTLGQKDRMRAALQSSTAQRNSLWADLNIAATGTGYETLPETACKADFLPVSNLPICEGTTMSFRDYSYFNIKSWQWSFEGGTPATSSEQHPTVTYNAPGQYKVTLTVFDGTNYLTVTKENQVIVLDNGMIGKAPYMQDFENLSLTTDSDFKVVNNNTDKTWVINPNVGYQSARSVYVNNRLITGDGNTDELVSGTFDLSNSANPQLFFKYAYAAIEASNTDELQIWVSTDCGESWLRKKVFKGSILRNNIRPVVGSTDYVPNDNEWKEGSLSLVGSKAAGLRIKFTWINGSGNNIYLDNINIADNIGVEENLAHQFSLNIFPNPVIDKAEIAFYLNEPANTSIELTDVLGRHLMTVHNGGLGSGEHSFQLSPAGLTPGIYFVNLMVNENKITRKIVIN